MTLPSRDGVCYPEVGSWPAGGAVSKEKPLGRAKSPLGAALEPARWTISLAKAPWREETEGSIGCAMTEPAGQQVFPKTRTRLQSQIVTMSRAGAGKAAWRGRQKAGATGGRTRENGLVEPSSLPMPERTDRSTWTRPGKTWTRPGATWRSTWTLDSALDVVPRASQSTIAPENGLVEPNPLKGQRAEWSLDAAGSALDDSRQEIRCAWPPAAPWAGSMPGVPWGGMTETAWEWEKWAG